MKAHRFPVKGHGFDSRQGTYRNYRVTYHALGSGTSGDSACSRRDLSQTLPSWTPKLFPLVCSLDPKTPVPRTLGQLSAAPPPTFPVDDPTPAPALRRPYTGGPVGSRPAALNAARGVRLGAVAPPQSPDLSPYGPVPHTQVRYRLHLSPHDSPLPSPTRPATTPAATADSDSFRPRLHFAAASCTQPMDSRSHHSW